MNYLDEEKKIVSLKNQPGSAERNKYERNELT